ncbi:MAG: hypothetical protein HGA76_06720 [Candidatus Firestonebacteria bacterium]|nr:hypothetical protein [Candidatus Firestonebacteria bacterium]
MPYNPTIHHRRSIRLKGYDYSQAGAYAITICCEDKVCRFGEIKNRQMMLNKHGQIACREWELLTERFVRFELDIFQIMPNHIHGIIVLNDIPVAVDTDIEIVGAGFTPAQQNITHDQNNTSTPNDDSQNGGPILGQLKNNIGQPDDRRTDQGRTDNGQPNDGQPRGLPLRDVAVRIPTVGDIVGAYKSLVVNACLDSYKSKNETMGKFWQRNYYEHVIRNEQSYQTISEYILHNPERWTEDKFYTK